MDLPKVMRAWQYGSISSGGIEASLKLNPSTPVPTPKADQHLVKIHSVSLNPVDYKPAENPVFRRLVVPYPSTPGIDFSGTIVKPAQNSTFKPGDRVFGCGPSPFAGGCLAEYAVAPVNATVAIPKGVSFQDASTIGVAGLSAWQSIMPYLPPTSANSSRRLFLNGGSGGVGVFGIQIAKAMGWKYVAVTCSERNIDFCTRQLGADAAVDYTKYSASELPQAIADSCGEVDHVVDNIALSTDLYYGAHKFSKPDAKFVKVGGGASLEYLWGSAKMKFTPSWLGGGKRKLVGFFANSDNDQLKQIADLMAEGKVKAVVDSTFPFEDTPQAFAKLKTSRARGKIVIEVDGK